jgi:stearoyl-CoA desaturase (Delta-9 desaturase)
MNVNDLPVLPQYLNGLLNLPWWGVVLYTLAATHVTIAAVTIYLHRHQAHRALDLHPVVSHFFRFWLWLSTGMVTKDWAAIHRKHHAKCETDEDPHSPQRKTLRKVLLQGAELYREAGRDKEMLEKYGHGTPDDWIERKVYSPHSVTGVYITLVGNVILFGPIGITIFAIQMLWIPVLAAGVVNGIGHFFGYRNFQSEDASTNIVPWGILIGGEELHNNHHAYASSAKLSNRWYEFDIGWMYIRILETFGLAQVKKVAPPLRFESKSRCDVETLQAVLTHRYDVLARFARSLKVTWSDELVRMRARIAEGNGFDARRISGLLRVDAQQMQRQDQQRLVQAMEQSKVLHTIYTMREELATVWKRSSATREQLVHQLEDWCHRAELSGIAALQNFSRTLRGYA